MISQKRTLPFKTIGMIDVCCVNHFVVFSFQYKHLLNVSPSKLVQPESYMVSSIYTEYFCLCTSSIKKSFLNESYCQNIGNIKWKFMEGIQGSITAIRDCLLTQSVLMCTGACYHTNFVRKTYQTFYKSKQNVLFTLQK